MIVWKIKCIWTVDQESRLLEERLNALNQGCKVAMLAGIFMSAAPWRQQLE